MAAGAKATGLGNSLVLPFRLAVIALGSRLIDRQSQNMTVAASATAERKTFGHRS